MKVYASAEMTITDTNDGVSVTGIDRYYMASSSSSGITVDSQGWKPDPQEINPISRYHWSYEVVRYSDGEPVAGKPAIIGVYGKEGDKGVSYHLFTTNYRYSQAELNRYVEVGYAGTWTVNEMTSAVKVGDTVQIAVYNTDKAGTVYILATVTAVANSRGLTTVSKGMIDKGDKGEQGVKGADGIGINNVVNYYKLTNTTTTPAYSDSGWATTPPTTTPTNRFLWNYEKITYSNNEFVNTPVAMIGVHGTNGVNGADGRSITSVEEYYLASGADNGITRATTGWTTTVQKPTDTLPYLWNYEKINFSSGNPTYTEPILIGYKARDGRNGTDGIAGRDGVGISSTTITYGLSTSDTVQPTTWTTQVPSLVKGQYLWTKTVWTYTNSTTETGYTKTYIARDGNNGTDGVAGKDGVGIKTTTITYASSTSGTTQPTSGWQSQVPSVPSGHYLWTKTVWTYTDNTTETGYSVSRMGANGAQGPQGPQGPQGLQGLQGPKGADGKSTYTWVRYSPNANGSGMTNLPDVNTKYIGIAVNKTVETESNVASDYVWSKFIGDNGVPGAKGADGKTTYTWIKYADTATGTGMSNDPTGKLYMGISYNQLTATESNTASDYKWSLIKGNDSSVNIMCGFTQGYSQRYLTRNKGAESITVLSDGWARLRYVNTTTTSQRVEYMFPKPEGITDGQLYTFLHEFRNNKSNANLSMYSVEDLDSAFFGNANGQFQAFVTQSEKRYVRQPHHPNRTLEQTPYLVMFNINVLPNQTLDVEVRLSCYVGDYQGPYIPYTGSLTGPQGATAYNHVAYIDASNTQTLDPLFNYGMNGIAWYNNANDGSLNIFREVNVPNSTQSLGKNRIRISHTKLGGSPGRGGFNCNFQGTNNSTYLIEFEAHAPVGSTLSMNNNALGTGGRTYWITDNKGIGAYRKYAYIVQYGTGTISTAGHISISHSEAVFDWYIANYQRSDITNKFSKEPIPNATHMGYQQTTSATQSSNISDYTWSSIAGSTSIEVGGRNLMINSMSRQPTSYGGSTMTYTFNQSVTEWKANDAVLVSGTKGTNDIFCYLHAGRPNSNLNENGTNYVHSIYIKNTGVPIQINNNMGTYVDIPSGTIARVVMKGMGTGAQSMQFNFTTTSTGNINFYYWHPQIETGTVVSDWTEALEDTNSKINEKASYQEVDALNSTLSTALNVLNDKANIASLNTLKAEYSAYNNARTSEIISLQNSAQSLLNRTSQIEINLGELSQKLSFIDRDIVFGNEGIYIGNKNTGNYLLINEQAISFYANHQVVATIRDDSFEFTKGFITENFRILNLQMREGNKQGHVSLRLV